MRPTLFAAPLVILLLDTAPGVVREDSSRTPVRVNFGIATSRYEEPHFDCEGNLVNAIPVAVRSGGVRFDWFGKLVRFTGFGGAVTTKRRDKPENGNVYEELTETHDGVFGGFQLAAEWRDDGVGAGAVFLHGEEDSEDLFAPSLYLRFGPVDSTHVRFEVYPPTEIFGNVAAFRAGIGHNQGAAKGARWFLGLGMWPYVSEEDFGNSIRLGGECDLPVSSRVDLLLRGQIGAGHEASQWSIGSGIGLRLPSTRAGSAHLGQASRR